MCKQNLWNVSQNVIRAVQQKTLSPFYLVVVNFSWDVGTKSDGKTSAIILFIVPLPCNFSCSIFLTFVGEPRIVGRGLLCMNSDNLGEDLRDRAGCRLCICWGEHCGVCCGVCISLGITGSESCFLIFCRLDCKSDKLGALWRDPIPQELCAGMPRK